MKVTKVTREYWVLDKYHELDKLLPITSPRPPMPDYEYEIIKKSLEELNESLGGINC